jgi:FkbM family methyltransferase
MAARSHGHHDIAPALRGWFAFKRAQLARKRHPELGEISAYCFYSTRLRFGQVAFDVGANHGAHTAMMVNRGARVVALEPQAKLAAQLADRFPAATVLRVAVSDQPGEALLHLFRESDEWASLDASWGQAAGPVPTTAKSNEHVIVTTLDDLIDEYGEPALVKIDTEGFDHRVLRGLSRPIEHILFEVHAARADDAAEAFERLDELGNYEYRISPQETWRYGDPELPREIMADLPDWGSVYARRFT